MGAGTGWAYHTNYHATWLLTCGHVAPDKNAPINVHRTMGTMIPANVVATTGWGAEDVAVIKVKVPNQPTLKLGSDVRQGDNVYGYGMPSGPPGIYAKGIVAGILGNFQLVSFQIGRGGSGGPIVGDDGKVCAMLRTAVGPGTRQVGNGVVKASTIIKWLKKQRLIPIGR